MSITEQTSERFDMGRVIGRTFGLVGRNFLVFLLMGVVFSGVPTGVVQWLQLGAIYRIDINLIVWLSLAGLIVTVVGGVVLQGALTRASIDDLSGKGASIGGALAAGFGLILPLIGLAIVMGLGQMLGFLLLVVPGIYLMVRWAVAAPVLVTEDTGVTAAMGRSSELTEGCRWAIFAIGLLFYLAVFGSSFISEFLAQNFLGGDIAALDSMFASAAIQGVLNVFVSIIGAAGVASIYFELRRVKEGIGVEELAKVFD